MKFCWDFKTKRLGKIEHTLSRDYSWSNFKSDFYLFEQFFLALSYSSLIGQKIVTGVVGSLISWKDQEGIKIDSGQLWPDFDSREGPTFMNNNLWVSLFDSLRSKIWISDWSPAECLPPRGLFFGGFRERASKFSR